MNTKVANQIAEMKKQTIGVEVEMNNIERSNADLASSPWLHRRRVQNCKRDSYKETCRGHSIQNCKGIALYHLKGMTASAVLRW